MPFISTAMFCLTSIATLIGRIMRSRFIINSFSFMSNVSVVFVVRVGVASSCSFALSRFRLVFIYRIAKKINR